MCLENFTKSQLNQKQYVMVSVNAQVHSNNVLALQKMPPGSIFRKYVAYLWPLMMQI